MIYGVRTSVGPETHDFMGFTSEEVMLTVVKRRAEQQEQEKPKTKANLPIEFTEALLTLL